MADAKIPEINNKPERIMSIDILRGITILLMIFVNDLAGVGGAPKWMLHYYPWDADGMTFVDVIFPAFLFIVGMSIPFAIGRRLKKGEPLLPIIQHILIRTIFLLIIGVFMVNSYNVAPNGTLFARSVPIMVEGADGVKKAADAGLLPGCIWAVLMYAGVMMTWNTPPKEPGKKRSIIKALKYVGIAILIFCALIYRKQGGSGSFQMRTEWWGILGLIGWAYLGACIIYLFMHKNPVNMMGMVGFLYAFTLADRMGYFGTILPTKLMAQYTGIGIGTIFGSQTAITASGVVLGMMLLPDSPLTTQWSKVKWGFFYGLFLLLAGHFAHQFKDVNPLFIVCKNAATIPWCLMCAGITALVWVGIYILTDIWKVRKWSVVVAPAGENPLFAYTLQPLMLSLFAITAHFANTEYDFYALIGKDFLPFGLFRSIAFAFFVVWLSGFLKRTGIWLRL